MTIFGDSDFFIHSTNILSVYSVPSTLLIPGETVLDNILELMEFTLSWGN